MAGILEFVNAPISIYRLISSCKNRISLKQLAGTTHQRAKIKSVGLAQSGSVDFEE